MQAEYTGLAYASREAIWIRQLLGELGFPQLKPTTIFGDNRAANILARDPKFHSRAKHIRIAYHQVRELVAGGEIQIEQVPSAENAADLLTKSLDRAKFETLRTLIGMAPETRGSVSV